MRRVLLALAILSLWGGPAAADVLGVRAETRTNGLGIQIDLDDAPAYRAFTLANPARAVIDFGKTAWKSKGLAGAKGAVAGFRHGPFRPDVYRLVIDLKRQAHIASARLAPSGDGSRLALDLVYSQAPSKTFGSLEISKQTAAARLPPSRTPAAPKPVVRTIVIDAGHGGVDPGAIGVGGVVEKRIVLAVAKDVRRLLERRPGYRVKLTRQRDIFLRLRERVRRGRAADADLFISIHADSHPNPAIAGASLYTLSEKASDKEAARLAKAENRADLIGGVELDEEPSEVVDILLDLTQRETKNRSSAAADDLLFALASNQPLLSRPKRAAGFAVLKAPDVPSVLIELGFLSNRKDARRLKSREGRARIARAIAEGVVRYFDGANTARAQTAAAPN